MQICRGFIGVSGLQSWLAHRYSGFWKGGVNFGGLANLEGSATRVWICRAVRPFQEGLKGNMIRLQEQDQISQSISRRSQVARATCYWFQRAQNWKVLSALQGWLWIRYLSCPCGGVVHREDICGLPSQACPCRGVVPLFWQRMKELKKSKWE